MNLLTLGFLLLVFSALNVPTEAARSLRNPTDDDDSVVNTVSPATPAPAPTKVPATAAPVKTDVKVNATPVAAPVRPSRNPSRASKKPVTQAPTEGTPITTSTPKPAVPTTSAPKTMTAVPTAHKKHTVATDSPVKASSVTLTPTKVADVTTAPSIQEIVKETLPPVPVSPVPSIVTPDPITVTPIPSTLAPIPSTLAPIPSTLAPIPDTPSPVAAKVTKSPTAAVKPVGGDDNEYEQEPTTDDARVDPQYVSPNDDPIKNSNEEQWSVKPGETPDQLVHDSNFVIALGATVGIMLLLMVCTAQQVMDNPDGLCAR
jgi:hypothetical protein